MTSFETLGLCDAIIKAVYKQGYTTPSPIQSEAIPVILSQRDVIGIAHTGTGKTACFSLPIIHLLATPNINKNKTIRALIITPTRELAAQIADKIQDYSNYLTLNAIAVFGGERIEPQIEALQNGVDILVATPGRLLDLYQRHALTLNNVEIIVLDEADRMLELGFIDDIHHIQQHLPKQRQSLLFSATFSDAIRTFAYGMLHNPITIETSPENSHSNKIQQTLYPVVKAYKADLLTYLIKINRWHQALVFCRTKHGADTLVAHLKQANIRADSIHADRSQQARKKALEDFKNGTINLLVATDIAARGIDINALPCVINFNLPYVAEDYIHRIGRTGRIGATGIAISFFSDDETKQLDAIERLINTKLAREYVFGFAPLKTTALQDNTLFEDEEYGHFEPDDTPKTKRRRKHKRGRR